jgi:hypothetical protein
MTDPAHPPGQQIWDVVVTPFRLTLHLRDGRSVGAPLSWFPRLEKSEDEERGRWRMASDGYSVQWPELGENVDVFELLRGRAAEEGDRLDG